MQGLQVAHGLLRLLPQLAGLGLQSGGGLEQQLLVSVHHLKGFEARGGLDAAHAAGHGELAADVEHAHLGGVVQVGAAAELHRVAAHIHHTDLVAVLLPEQGGGSGLLGLLDAHDLGVHGVALQDGLVYNAVHLAQLLSGHGGEVGEVKAQVVGLHQRAGLVHMAAQHGLQGLVEQVGGGVGSAYGVPAGHVDLGGDGVSQLQSALGDLAVVHILAALVLLHVGDGKQAAVFAALGDDTVVGHLAAHLRVEGGLVQHHNALYPGHELLGLLILHHQGHHLGAGDGVALIAHKLGLGHILAELHAGPAQVAQGLPGLPGPLALLLHQLVERLLVQCHALLLHHFQGQIHGEAVGVVQLEGVLTGEDLLPLLLVLGEHVVENSQAAVDGLGEVLLLHPDDLGDIVLALPQLGVVALVLVDDGVAHLVQEGLVHPQQLTVAGGPAQQAAQHIAPALVGGEHPVADHKGGGADVVGDDPQGHVHTVALAVGGPGELGDLVGDVHHRVHVKQGGHLLAHAGQALQAHAGVDVLLLELGVVALAVVVELGEDDVPHLDIPVAVAAHGTAGLAAAPLGAPVVVDLGAGAAGAGAVLPEVVLLAELEDAVLGDADLIPPDGEGLVVGGGGLIAGKDGGVEPLRVQTHPLGGGQELPGPVDGVVLEVVPEGEVAQHLEISAVAGGLADVLNVAGADALLTGAYPVAGGLLLSGEPGLHGGHAAVDEQQGRVILRNQREAGETQVLLGLKKFQEHLPQLVQSKRFRVSHNQLPPKYRSFSCVTILMSPAFPGPPAAYPPNSPLRLPVRLEKLQPEVWTPADRPMSSISGSKARLMATSSSEKLHRKRAMPCSSPSVLPMVSAFSMPS